MNHPLLEIVNKKFNEAFSVPWGNRQPIRGVLSSETTFDSEKKGLIGEAIYQVQAKDGQWKDIHHEPMGILKTEEEIEDWIAKGFSTFLMNHLRWPK